MKEYTLIVYWDNFEEDLSMKPLHSEKHFSEVQNTYILYEILD